MIWLWLDALGAGGVSPAEWLTLALSARAAREILLRGSLFADARAGLQASGGLLADLTRCRLCLTPWCAALALAALAQGRLLAGCAAWLWPGAAAAARAAGLAPVALAALAGAVYLTDDLLRALRAGRRR